MSKFRLLTLIESVLGKSKSGSKDNRAFFCPFCNHYKQKLEIDTTSQHWHCWVCNAKGRKLVHLFAKLHVERSKIQQLLSILDETDYSLRRTDSAIKVLNLPPEYTPLWKINKTPEFRNAAAYLKSRDISIFDILKYRIGYCPAGEYSGKIIIPSYDDQGNLNYFVGRSYYEHDTYKHKCPQVSKNFIIGFDLMINWKLPIILVEGAFDAITIKRNAIPLFGKIMNTALRQKIEDKHVSEVYVCLDQDAKKQAIDTAEYFINNGIDVYFVDMQDKDPNQMGFEKIWELINNTTKLTEFELMEYKVLSI
jgi:DNA primase